MVQMLNMVMLMEIIILPICLVDLVEEVDSIELVVQEVVPLNWLPMVPAYLN